jgi:cysteine desulfurase
MSKSRDLREVFVNFENSTGPEATASPGGGYNHLVSLIYLDNNATTQPDPAVVAAMMPFLSEFYGNPSSVHRFGQRSRAAIDQARTQIGQLVGCADSELLFSGGGTEAINTAVRGLANARLPKRKIVTTTVEHSATRELCQQLGREGWTIVEIAVSRDGELDLVQLNRELEDAALASIMWANNETGVIFPIAPIAELLQAAKVPLHVDATQAIGTVPVDFKALGIDAASFASHKFHGPKGVGALYVRRGLRMPPLLIGGPQERGRRGGTENVAGIVGMGLAAELARASLGTVNDVARKRDRLERAILTTIPETSINGTSAARLPNTTNISFAALEAEAILLLLSEQDVCASAGAACSSGSLEPSHVLRAMGIPERVAHGAIRFSLSRFTTHAEIDAALRILPPIIQRLRAVLPVG